MCKTILCTTLLITIAVLAGHPPTTSAQESDVTTLIAGALPDKPYAQPTRPRRMLVFTLTRGYRHGSIPVGVQAIEALGRKTGAFEVFHTEDPAVFEPQSLARFDAVCMLNTTGELFTVPDLDDLDPAARIKAGQTERRLKQSLLNFVAEGGDWSESTPPPIASTSGRPTAC